LRQPNNHTLNFHTFRRNRVWPTAAKHLLPLPGVGVVGCEGCTRQVIDVAAQCEAMTIPR
jgi:hypothetical protein